MLGTRVLVEAPSGVTKFEFSDNFVSENSDQRSFRTTRAGTAEGIDLLDNFTTFDELNEIE